MTDDTYNDRPALTAYIAILFTLMSLYCISTSLTGQSYNVLLLEGGIVETLSAVLYFVLAGMMLLRGGKSYLVQKYYFLILVLFFGLRELDFDKKFTTMGIFKSRFYVSGEVPVLEKLLGGGALLLLLYCIVQIFRKHFVTFLKEARNCSALNIGLWLAGLLLIFSKSIDGLDRKLKGFGVEISHQFTDNAAAFEEILELGIPSVMLLVAHVYFKQRHVEANAPAK